MDASLSPMDLAKHAAATRAAQMVEDGMRVGLGTGSTAAWLVHSLGEMVREDGLRIRAVPTSTRTADLARDVGIDVITLDEAGWLDLTIDGADEFDGELTLIKGGGGALLQEKIVAIASDRMVVIADAGKEVAHLGAYPLPVEIVRFGHAVTQRLVEEALSGQDVLGRDTVLRLQGGEPYLTDEGHYILDCALGRIEDPRRLSQSLLSLPGVVETGLFCDICDAVVIGHGDGRVVMRDLDGTAEEARVDVPSDDLLDGVD
ncbi:MAG: ribose-5-phosphate isomerase RpiA [Paracoccaceae bacterium]